MIAKTISHYKILEKIGSGGMGVVYKAQDLKLDRFVALKFLPPTFSLDDEAKQRFIHEAKAASSLEHPNICNIHEIDETEKSPDAAGGQLFIAMAFYEGETLKNKIEKGPLKIDEAINIVTQVAEGLNKAHQKNIIHRDIKPANIFITDDGIVKILDFGLSKVTGQTQLTQMGSTIGTAAYMSPEQARGEKVDHRTDIWSIGVSLYEMIIGQPPFKGEYEQSLIYTILNEQPEPVTSLRTGISMELERIINKCLEKKPSDRYQHVDEFITDLRRIKKVTDSKSHISKIAAEKKFSINKKLLYSILTVLFIVVPLVIGRFLFFTQDKTTSDTDLKMLVVLPFENLGLPEDQYFADGITDEITSRLSAVKSMGVISRKSAFNYANTNATTERIGEELNVDYIITGTVRWAKSLDGLGKVRITPSLIQVSNDLQIWAEPFERVITDIFQIQSDIAKKVIQQLDVEIIDSELKSVENKPTQNLESYHAFLQGRYYERKPHFTVNDWLQVVNSYQRAVELDSTFALAYADLAKSHARLIFLRYDISGDRIEKARSAAEKALKLSPESPEVHYSLGYYFLWAERNTEQALIEWEIASKSLKNNADIMRANTYVYEIQGRFEEAIDASNKAMILSPRDASNLLNLALHYWYTRQYSNAIDVCDRAILLAPDAVWSYIYKVAINWSWNGPNEKTRIVLKAVPPEHEFYPWLWYWQEVSEKKYDEALQILSSTTGEWVRHKLLARPKSFLSAFIYEFLNQPELAQTLYEEARIMLETEVKKWPEDPRYHSSLGIVYAALDQTEKAIHEGKRAMEILPISKDAVYGVPYVQDLAIIYTMIGDYDAAINQLEYLLSIPSWLSIPWIKMNPTFLPLFDNPKFQQLVKDYSGND
ncbi:protein kinase [Bacteroidota bacterium]